MVSIRRVTSLSVVIQAVVSSTKLVRCELTSTDMRTTDFYVSPGDPYFWLHHSMIDRVWWIWQAQDFANRQQVIAGGTSMLGGGRAQSLEDSIDLEVLNVDGKPYKIKELVSTVAGPLCYVYE
jgi:tyrosinase